MPACDQNSVLNLVQIEKLFLLQEAMCSYNRTQVSPYDPTKLAIHSILRPEDDLISDCGRNFKQIVSFNDIVHVTDEENSVTYVDFHCDITFFPETPTKFRQINRERNHISGACEEPKCIPSNDQFNCSINELHSSNNFLSPHNSRDMVPAALMSLNHTNDRYSISVQYPQPTTKRTRTDSFPVFSSLPTMDSERKRLRVKFAFFQRNYLPDGRINETVAKVEELSDLWEKGPRP